MRTRPHSALAILTTLNLLNLIDRSILFQVQPLIQEEFRVSNTQIGLLTTAFMLSLMIAAPVLGWLADHYPRRPIIVTGAIVWSIATLLTATATTFPDLLLRRAVLGIGEACMVAAPGYVADLFPQERRGRVLAFLYMASSVGAALGLFIGGLLGERYGWRMPFYVAAGPGVVVALLLLLTREPERGAYDTVAVAGERATITGLLRNRAYLTTTLALAMLTFTLGGTTVWVPKFLMTVRGMTMVSTATFLGGISVVCGVFATIAGGWLADRARKRRHDADYLLAAVIAAVTTPLVLAGVYVAPPMMFPVMFCVPFLLIFNYVPLGTAMLQSVPAQVRSTAVALHIIVLRLLGDAISPPIMGYVADRTGSLQLGFIPAAAAVGLAVVILLYGKRYAPRPQVAAPGALMVSIGK